MSYALSSDGQGWRSVNGPEDLLPGETLHETEPVIVQLPLTKVQRIANVLATVAGGRDRTTVQLAILIGEMVLAPYAAQLYSVSLEIALMGIYARNKTYRLCKDAETLIEAIEDEPE